MTTDTWNPEQYARFHDERSRPFFDLLALVRPTPGMRVVDLGCGTGELTRALHERLGAAETLGLDASPAMLARSADYAGDGLRFERGDIAEFAPAQPFDLVFSNAALQWVPDHERLLPRLAAALRPAGGQLAIQMPTNDDHLSHVTAHRIAQSEPFRTALGGYVRQVPLLKPERYAEILDELGFGKLHVRMQVYAHHLPEPGSVVEWVKGSLLTDYQRRLPPELFDEFLARYREALLPQLPDRRPYFYPFKRLLIWGMR